MVAHNVADAPSLLAVMIRRREDPLIMFLTLGAVRHATRQCQGAMLRGGSFDRSAASPRLHEEWRKHHEAELSSADQTQEV